MSVLFGHFVLRILASQVVTVVLLAQSIFKTVFELLILLLLLTKLVKAVAEQTFEIALVEILLQLLSLAKSVSFFVSGSFLPQLLLKCLGVDL